MTDDLRMQRYTATERAGVFDLMSAAFSEDYANHLMRLWDWKYDSHPLNREAEQARRANREKLWPLLIETYSMETLTDWGISFEELDTLPSDAPYLLLIKDRDKVVAMQGSLPQAFLINGSRQLVSTICDLAVHPDYRGRSLSMRLRVRIAAEHGLTLGWANVSSLKIGFRWLKGASRQRRLRATTGWGTMRVVALVKPIDWSYMTRRATGISVLGSAAAVAAAAAHRVSSAFGKPSATMPGVEVFKLEAFDGRIDELWHRASQQHQVIGERDSTYLNWRFNARPDASYVCLAAARGSNIIGYLVYRVVEREGGRWGYIVDFLTEGDTTSAFAMLFSHAEARMIREGVQSIVCVMAKAPFRQTLRRAGFIPALFHQPSFVGGAVTSPDPHLKAYAEVRKWFVTMGDGDAEMVF